MRREELDPQIPFFVSYAHSGRDSNQKAERLYGELCDGVSTMVALPMGIPIGFFDVEGLPAAVQWGDELADMLGTCQVLVALISAPYLSSDWCGREWDAFAKREKIPLEGASGIQNQGAVIPVRWAPMTFEPPKVVGDQQFFTPRNTRELPDIRKEYEEEGIFGLLKRGKEAAFYEICWQLAKRIAQMYYSQLLRPREFGPDDLINVFRREIP